MPVEIKELIIRTTVDTQNRPANSGQNSNDCASRGPSENDQVQIDEVLKMMRNKNER